jgi:hypothetical protein
MSVDEGVATFLDFQRVIQNLGSFRSSSLGYIVSKAAVIKWNKFQENQEKDKAAQENREDEEEDEEEDKAEEKEAEKKTKQEMK